VLKRVDLCVAEKVVGTPEARPPCHRMPANVATPPAPAADTP
jgi:hypothetical protein